MKEINILTFVEKVPFFKTNLVLLAPSGSNIMSGFYLLHKENKVALKIISPMPFDFSERLKNKLTFPRTLIDFKEDWFFEKNIDKTFQEYKSIIEKVLNELLKTNKNKFLVVFNFFTLCNLRNNQLEELKNLFLKVKNQGINLIFVSPASNELSKEENNLLKKIDINYELIKILSLKDDKSKNKFFNKLTASKDF